MNIYRNIDRSKVQFDFLYHYTNETFYDDEIRSLGGKIYKLSIRNDNNLLKYCRELDEFFGAHKEYHVIHCHYSGFGMFYNHYAKKHGVQFRIGHSHSDKYETGLIGQLDRFMSKPFRYGLTDRFACSESAGRFLYGKYPFSVYLNGIDVDGYSFSSHTREIVRKQYGLREENVVIGHVGRFEPVKNHSFLLEVFSRLYQENAHYKLVLVGDGGLRKDVERQAEALGIAEAVVFAGLQKRMVDIYNMFDLFVLPSHFEGIPLSLIEAQANGLHCIASEAVNPASDVTGCVGYLPLEHQAWCEQIRCADIARSGDSPDKVRQAGYDICTTAAQMQEFYLRCVSEQTAQTKTENVCGK